jgi:hypothetical protein
VRVTSIKGQEAELLAVSYCTYHGLVPHRIGEHGSAECAVCITEPVPVRRSEL